MSINKYTVINPNAIAIFTAPISTLVLERFSCRTAIVSSGCLFFIGFLGTAFAPNIECVIFTYGFVAGKLSYHF